MSLDAGLQAFVTVFPAELPDKTMVASIVLVTRYRRPRAVWVGAVAAFAFHVVFAVAAGSALSLLPDVVVKSAVAALFTVGAVLLVRAARHHDDEDLTTTIAPTSTAWSAMAGSFGLILLAEWGDLTQLVTASLAAKSHQPVATGVGALAALAAVAGIAVTIGQRVVKRFDLAKINYVGAVVFAAFAVLTVVELVA